MGKNQSPNLPLTNCNWQKPYYPSNNEWILTLVKGNLVHDLQSFAQRSSPSDLLSTSNSQIASSATVVGQSSVFPPVFVFYTAVTSCTQRPHVHPT
jgi:hypothetical protein